jgi:hypothetical protein
MPRLLFLVLIACLAVVLGGCAAPHYNLDVRNMTGEVVGLELVSSNPQLEGGRERVVAKGRVGPGSAVSMFNEGQRGDRKPHLLARVEGDEGGEPARLEIKSGLSSIDIYDAPQGAKSRIRLREVVRP